MSQVKTLSGPSLDEIARYSRVAIVLHWLIAALLAANLYIGWQMTSVEGMARFERFQLHKSVGMTILLLSLMRLGWRLFRAPPAAEPSMQRWENVIASVVHWAMYVFMIAMPLTGWIIVSASPLNLPTLLFKTVTLPHIGLVHDLPLTARRALEGQFGELHEAMAFGFVALIALHVMAALKHQFIDRDRVLFRMLPTGRDGGESGA